MSVSQQKRQKKEKYVLYYCYYILQYDIHTVEMMHIFINMTLLGNVGKKKGWLVS